ncbi:MAG: anthranilate synthase component I [Xenococcaceae cyanobacterium]
MNSLSPWYWRSLPLENRTGSEILARLFLDRDKIVTLLESPVTEPLKEDKLSRYSICAGSPRQVDGKPQLWTPSLGKILPFLRSLLPIPTAIEPSIEHLPFTGGWLGWLGYDLAWEIEKLPNLNCDSLPFPVAYWYEPADFAVLDHQKQLLWLAASVPEELDRLEDKLTTIPISSPAEENILKTLENTLPRPLPPLTFVTSQIDYENSVRQALKYIQAGDIFQTNLSLRFETQTSADSWSIYRALQQINPSPFASYWQTPWGAVISCSPERLIQLQGNYAQTRPIAGTRSRGTNPQSDRKIAEEFIVNFKERAEHIMLVDLERNDLGKVCQWGSVKVDELLSIERYSHVMHLVSNVIGNLRSEFDGIDLIRATFPGGTITGCPKVRCLEIIEELEPVRRNLFYGSCGYLDRRGWLDLNILIRTLLYSKPSLSLARVWGQVGAGIVADSDPSQEWHESLNKAEAQLTALQLFI